MSNNPSFMRKTTSFLGKYHSPLLAAPWVILAVVLVLLRLHALPAFFTGHAQAAQATPDTALPVTAQHSRVTTPHAHDPARKIPGLAKMASSYEFSGLIAGHGPVQLTVFIDPNCVYCHLMWERLSSLPNAASLFTITYVPVAFLKPSSVSRAEAILVHGHAPLHHSDIVENVFSGGAAALALNETHFRDIREEGAITPFDEPKIRAIIVQNSKNWIKLMKQLGRNAATPTTIVNGDRLMVGAPTVAILKEWAHRS